MRNDFAKNLRWLCAEAGPIAQTCRGLGINRQQFNRYLNGSGLPAAHILRRIERYFHLPEGGLFATHAEFCARHHTANPAPNPALQELSQLFQDQSRPLRRFLGSYHSYFRTPTWPGRILRSLVHLRAEGGQVVTHSFERAASLDSSIRQHGRYHGLASLRGNRICMYETPRRAGGFLSETVMMPLHPQQVSYLQGLSLGISARADQQPFCTRTVWVRIPERVTAREALAVTGAYAADSPKLDPKVLRLLGEQSPISALEAPP